MKVLVTGGAGFNGSHVVDALCEEGRNVICIDSLDSSVHRALPDYVRRDAEYCIADLRNWVPDRRFDDNEHATLSSPNVFRFHMLNSCP